jgi:hypothetical protein
MAVARLLLSNSGHLGFYIKYRFSGWQSGDCPPEIFATNKAVARLLETNNRGNADAVEARLCAQYNYHL